MITFGEILETIDQLPYDDKLALNDILNKRVNEEKREKLIAEVMTSRYEYEIGLAKPTTVNEIMNQITSEE